MDRTFFKVIIGLLCLYSLEAALPTNCNEARATCPANSVCTENNNCVCSDGFKEEEATCIAKVIGDSCDDTNGCTGLENTDCTGGACNCIVGYAEKDGDCIKIIGQSCPDTGTCSDLADNTVCEADKCQCGENFGEKDNVCVRTVSGTTCADGGTECNNIANSACPSGGTSCECNAGFKESIDICAKVIGGDCPTNPETCERFVDNTACTAGKCECADDFDEKVDVCVRRKVTETSCTKGTAEQCKHTPNAECDNAETGAKCICSDGYAEDKTDGSTCLKILGGTCEADGDCTEAGEAVCTDEQCSCKADFGEKDNQCVKTVSGTTCSENGKECDNIDNSHCHTDKCKCDAGYVMNVNACTAENSAVSIQLGTLTVLLSGLATLIQKF